VACGRVLIGRSVWTVRVVVLDELLKHHGEVARPGDRKMVEPLAAQRADQRSAMVFARGARTGVWIMQMSAPAKTASKAAVNVLSNCQDLWMKIF